MWRVQGAICNIVYILIILIGTETSIKVEGNVKPVWSRRYELVHPESHMAFITL